MMTVSTEDLRADISQLPAFVNSLYCSRRNPGRPTSLKFKFLGDKLLGLLAVHYSARLYVLAELKQWPDVTRVIAGLGCAVAKNVFDYCGAETGRDLVLLLLVRFGYQIPRRGEQEERELVDELCKELGKPDPDPAEVVRIIERYGKSPD